MTASSTQAGAAGADRLVDALARLLSAHTGQPVTRHETHISWILLSGDEAWKLKRPVRLPFVDFTAVEARRRYCEAEVRLNRRLAPELYRGVVPVTGPVDRPVVALTDDDGAASPAAPALDWFVRMRRFPAGALFSERLAAGRLTADDVERLARRLAAFDRDAEVQTDPALADGVAREAAKVVTRLRELAAARAGPAPGSVVDRIDRIGDWLRAEAARLAPVFARRLAAGRVRDVHGDLHLANAVVLERNPAAGATPAPAPGEGGAGAPGPEDPDVTAFDCVEFDDALRRIDVIGDPAFLSMDLIAHGRADLARCHVDAWCEAADDRDGVAVLRLHQVYRAGVRAMVAWLGPPDGHGKAGRYLDTAERVMAEAGHAPLLTITCGVSGSGKSFAARRLIEREGGLRLRSDVERKRLAGLDPLADSKAAGIDLYTSGWSARTYARLALLAETVLRAGHSAVVDAAFLKQAERHDFGALARRLGVGFRIVECRADPELLRRRIEARAATGRDPSEATVAVLERQLGFVEPLDAGERTVAVPAPTD